MFDYIVYDAIVRCVMSENGKHWELVTNNPPERTGCGGCIHWTDTPEPESVCRVCANSFPNMYRAKIVR